MEELLKALQTLNMADTANKNKAKTHLKKLTPFHSIKTTRGYSIKIFYVHCLYSYTDLDNYIGLRQVMSYI